MAYQIEFGLRPGAYFYAEFLITDKNTGNPVPLTDVAHQMVGRRDGFEDCVWGCYLPPYVLPPPDSPIVPIPPPPAGYPASPVAPDFGRGWVLASEAGGEIKHLAPGVLAIAIPARRFWFGGERWRTLRFDLFAIPPDPDFTTLLASGTISFGDRTMPAPRIQLDVYPLYPSVGQLPASQYLRALSAVVPNGRATLESLIPANPDDPQRIILENTQTVPPNGALESMVATLLALSPGIVAQIRQTALTFVP